MPRMKLMPPRARPDRFNEMIAIEKQNRRMFLCSQRMTTSCCSEIEEGKSESMFQSRGREINSQSNKAIVPNLFRGGAIWQY